MGRRNLLLMGAIGMCIAQFVVAIVGITTASLVANKILISFVCIYIFFFACSWGPVAWVVTGELFPLKLRAKALSITTATNWLFNFAIGFSTPYIVDDGPGNANLGPKVFFIWGGCCFMCMLFVWTVCFPFLSLSLQMTSNVVLMNDCAVYLRDKGSLARGGRRALRNHQPRVELNELYTIHKLCPKDTFQ